jgi:hypothetical protein
MDLQVRIIVTNSSTVRERWPEFEAAIAGAFAVSVFSDDVRPSRPIKYSHEVVFGPESEELCHAIALDQADQIIGALFRLPVASTSIDRDWEPGFFFTSEKLPSTQRIQIATLIVEAAHQLLKSLGYERVVCGMGTAAGARFLTRRFGYTQSPSERTSNRWVREL